MTSYIYALVDPRAEKRKFPNEVRYIGKTDIGLKERWEKHISEAQSSEKNKDLRTKKNSWILSLLKVGLKPIIKPIFSWEEHQVHNKAWAIFEINWIFEFRKMGHRLKNLTNGGDGAKGYKHTSERKAKISAANTGKKMDKQVCDRISANKSSPEAIAKQVERNAIMWAERRANGWVNPTKGKKGKPPWSKGLKLPPLTDEHKAKLSATLTGRTSSNKGKPAWNKGMKDYLSSESRAKLSVSAKARVRKPHSEETKLKIGLGSLGLKRSAETRAKISAARIAHENKKTTRSSDGTLTSRPRLDEKRPDRDTHHKAPHGEQTNHNNSENQANEKHVQSVNGEHDDV